MSAARPLPVKPSLTALLAERTAPWHVRRPLARAVAEVIVQRKPYAWARALEYVLLRTSDVPRERRKRERDPMSGKVISETPEQTAAYEQAKAAQNGSMSPEQQELTERRATRARHAEAQRERWLDSSGFGAVIEKAETLLADLDRALVEHRQAQAALPDLVTFLALAQETPEDAGLQRFGRRARDLAQTIASPPTLVANAPALRELIARVRAADLADANGPVRNSNLVAAWRRQFQELVTPLPQPGYPAWCRQQVQALLQEARIARASRR